MGEHFGWMHLLSVTLFVVGAVLAADPEQAVASVGSNLLGSCLALASGVCSASAYIVGRKLKEVNPAFLTISNMFHTWIFCWAMCFVPRVPSGSLRSMEGAHLQGMLFPGCVGQAVLTRRESRVDCGAVKSTDLAIPTEGLPVLFFGCGRFSKLAGAASS
ncbi:unnamed protein product [Effrenium voratum]|nr:unnamed protein product [Effrenium voratum]